MGFFRNLWDDALAGGSTSEPGVGKFRRYNSLLSRRLDNPPAASEDNTPISRSITILRTDSLSSSGSTPASPTGSSAAGSPLSGNARFSGGTCNIFFGAI